MQSSSKGLAARANRGMGIPHPVHQLAFRSSSRRLIKAYAGGVRIVFHMPFKCEMGDHVAVVGAGDLLGHWAIEKRLPLNWTEGDEWVGELDVPAGTTLEYKYIVVRADGSIEWSPGNNYVLEVPHSRGACMSVYEGWVKEGPRHVNITEMDGHRASSSSGPAPGQAGQQLQPDTAQDLVNSMVLKLNSATERLMRMEAEAAVCGLLTQYPSITVSKLHRAMMTLKLKNPDLTQDQLQSLLDSMERQQKVFHTEGKYKINPGPANKALKTAMPATPGATPVPRREAEDASKGSSALRPGAPKPARRMSPSSPAAFGRGPDVVGTSTPTPVLVPAIMKLLEVYSGMTLERLHRVLCGAVPNFTATMNQLESVLVSLNTEGRVILQDGLYKKGMATPSPNRRSSTPTAGRRPSSAAGSPSPPPPPTRSRNDRAAYVAAATASPASGPVTEEQLLSYESRVLSLLSNYSGCTCERLLGQLKATSDFPGNKQDLNTLLNRLASEGRVRDESGIYRYVSKRSLTPMGARGVSPTATHPTRTNGNLPAPARAPAPAPAPARNGNANGSKKGAPVTAFELYCADYREPVKARHPRAGQAEVNELLAREWAGAHSITRNRYEALEKSEKARLGYENSSNGSGAGGEQDGGEDEYSRSMAGSNNASRVSNRWWN